MRRILPALGIALLAAGCATTGAVRELGAREQQVIDAVSQRLKANEKPMRDAAATLGSLGAAYAEKEFNLELALAKAKRLDSMRAPWAAPTDDLVKTQRAVVLYHLYAVEMAEQKVLDARMQERRAAAQEIFAAYKRLVPLLEGASKSLETVLQYLNQPKSASILAFTREFLGEVTDFRQTLQASENPRLRALAERVAQYEQQAAAAQEQAQRALAAILTARGE